ncbi:hypothetical protein BUALT_Bualt02G0017400 [Buddleja alternifolia]|uniref:Glucosidase 2 subunit beta n=1 Tax=Buddleja alternifolia TaxID=168488 RepID=A0AAV6Y7B5_9LAMI|nr:hypothetical protein BUALT_Bualt02G0017400 [Buddleja alternifolia]
MSLPMVDCRNLIEFCRAFERHSSNSNSNSNSNFPPRSRRFTINPFSHHQFCCHRGSPFAAVDLIILLLVIGSLGFLFVPYFTFFFCEVLPLFHDFITDIILDAPLAYFTGLVLALLALVFALLVWEIIDMRLRRCGNPNCKGLRRAVEYDIQLESEECIKYSSHPPPSNSISISNARDDETQLELELGQDRKELEAELKKMAPPNGRTVLIFRAPCGCPAGRLEDLIKEMTYFIYQCCLSYEAMTMVKPLFSAEATTEHHTKHTEWEVLKGSVSIVSLIFSSWYNTGSCPIDYLLSMAMASLPPKHYSLLGVAPQDESYYKGLSSSSSATIKCKDGSNMILFSKSQLNDDFCDCPDGSDEPGTSACPTGKFYCRNAGHSPLFIYSSRVNDGICDCCDGSDEYDLKIKCPNICWEAGKVAREKLKKKIATHQEGVTVRKWEIKQAKSAMAKDEAELSRLKDEEKILKGLVQQLKERKEQIENAEEKERLQKEKEEKERKEAEEAQTKDAKAEEKLEDFEPMENDVHDKTGTIYEPLKDTAEEHHESVGDPELGDHPIKEGHPDDDVEENVEHQGEDSIVDGKVGLDTENQEKNVAEDTETLSREDLGRLVASRWTGQRTEEIEDGDASANTDHQNPDETPNEANDEEYIGYDSENDDRYDDSEDQVDDFPAEDHYDSSSSDKFESDDESDLSDVTVFDPNWSDITGTSSSSWLEKIQQKVRSIIQAVNLFQTPVNKSESAYVRKEYDESSAKLSKIESRISSLTKKLKQDFGPEKEFYSFYGQCFETKQNKYVYKVCPFKQATQEEDHSTTRLGSWEKFEDSYRIMQFLNGDKCWNGPDRSLKVKLRCGLKNEITDIGEPSRCEYLALFSTPALCLDTTLEELQDKLESLNTEHPEGHDEL